MSSECTSTTQADLSLIYIELFLSKLKISLHFLKLLKCSSICVTYLHTEFQPSIMLQTWVIDTPIIKTVLHTTKSLILTILIPYAYYNTQIKMCYISSSYSVPKLRYRPPAPNRKTFSG